MNARRWEQLAAACGIVWVVLQNASQGLIQIGGMEPAFNASAAEILAFFEARNASLFGVGDYLQSLSVIAWVFFMGALWARLRRFEDDPGWLSMTALGSGLLVGTIYVAGGGWTLAMGRLDAGLDADTARLLFDQGNFGFANIWVVLAGMLLAVGIHVRTYQSFPRWMGWGAFVVALSLIVARAFWASGNGAIFLPYLLLWAWVSAASVVLVRRAGSAE